MVGTILRVHTSAAKDRPPCHKSPSGAAGPSRPMACYRATPVDPYPGPACSRMLRLPCDHPAPMPVLA